MAPLLIRSVQALCEATKEVVGKADPYAICGSLPLVADLKEAGYDIQLTGYGLTSTYVAPPINGHTVVTFSRNHVLSMTSRTLLIFVVWCSYHADNEYCELGDMRNAAKILSRIIKKLHEQ